MAAPAAQAEPLAPRWEGDHAGGMTDASEPQPPATTFFADEGMNFDLLTTLGAAPMGTAEVGEVLAMVDAIRAAGESYQAYFDAFHAGGTRLVGQARASERNGDAVRATHEALRASNYLQSALFFVLGSDRASHEQRVYEDVADAWNLAAPNLAPVAEPLSIPFGDRPMPGWFFAPDDSGRPRRTLVVSNGSDGQYVWVWGFIAAAALERDWNVVLFEGPGQGSMLFVHHLPFRADWEAVITPVVDHLSARTDVDAGRIALLGGSMSGELTARAAAFEHRLAALVTAPGSVAPWRAFPEVLRDIVTDDPGETNRNWNEGIIPFLNDHQVFTLRKRLEIYDPHALAAVRRGELPSDFWTPTRVLIAQDVSDVAAHITCPTLVVDYEGETFYAGQADELHDLLTCPKDLVRMTTADGAQLHCSPLAPHHHADVVLSWLGDTVGGAD